MFKRWLVMVAIGWAWMLAITPLPLPPGGWPALAIEVLVFAVAVASLVFVFTLKAPLFSSGLFVELFCLSLLAMAGAQAAHLPSPWLQFGAVILSFLALVGYVIFRKTSRGT